MAFDPKKHLIRIQGNREYLPVAARLIWFREDHPDWGIATQPVEINIERQYVIFSASIFNADGKLMAMATKMENVRGFPDYLEKAETGSVGRALAMVGYGTQFAPELDEGDRLADSPQPGRGNRPSASRPPAQRPQPAPQGPPANAASTPEQVNAMKEFSRRALAFGYDTFLDGKGAPSRSKLIGFLQEIFAAEGANDRLSFDENGIPSVAAWTEGVAFMAARAATGGAE